MGFYKLILDDLVQWIETKRFQNDWPQYRENNMMMEMLNDVTKESIISSIKVLKFCDFTDQPSSFLFLAKPRKIFRGPEPLNKIFTIHPPLPPLWHISASLADIVMNLCILYLLGLSAIFACCCFIYGLIAISACCCFIALLICCLFAIVACFFIAVFAYCYYIFAYARSYYLTK